MIDLRRLTLFILASLLLVTGLCFCPAAKAQTGNYLTIVLKVRYIDQFFGLIDQIAQEFQKPGQPLPTAMIRGMLQGTEWIDDQRAIVVAVDTSGLKPTTTILIPFLEANDNFKNSFNAIQGSNYYLVGFNPGQQVEVTPENRKALEEASNQPGQGLVSLEISPARLIRQNKDSIAQQMLKLDTMPNTSPNRAPGATPHTIKELLTGLIQIGEQVEKLNWSLDVKDQNLSFIFEARATDQSDLARLFRPESDSWRMANMQFDAGLEFRSRSFDIEGIFNIISTLIEPLSKQSGYNFHRLLSIAHSFTGEMAAGVSFSDNKIMAQTVMVLKDRARSSRFIEDVYLPWIADYMQTIRSIMEKQGFEIGQKPYIRTTDSQVHGQRVYGMELRLPGYSLPARFNRDDPGQRKQVAIKKYPVRMTVVQDMFLTAPNDKALAVLIARAQKAKTSPVPDWLLRYTVDTKAYLKNMASAFPYRQVLPEIPAGLGKTVSLAYAENGKFSCKTVVGINDIKAILAFFKALANSAATGYATDSPTRETVATQPRPAKKPLTPLELVDKGNLFSTYGNYKAAIRYYRKALSQYPDMSEAYFNLGLAYGELEEYEQAIKALDKAIQLMPDNAVYYYGRARVLLLAGRSEEAMSDFRSAAELGNADAQRYIASQGKK